MDSLTQCNSMPHFVELNRSFRELSNDQQSDDEYDIGFAMGFNDPILWPKILDQYRVIILSEAGSGKTEEILNIACSLRTSGKNAFFLRLENLKEDFEGSFEIGNFKEFSEWLSSGKEGWIFLDSVDEARLCNPKDFHSAIRKLSSKVVTAMERVHIVITSRSEAWRPKTDLDFCIKKFPFSENLDANCEVESDESDDEELLEDQDKNSIFKIYTIEKLNSTQIKIFTEKKGVEDFKEFSDAIERADALLYTASPQDLDELIRYWLDNGKIGSRLELMKNSINSRLIERDQDRAEIKPFSKLRACEGVKLLAAATTLIKDSTIRIPDGTNNSLGISAKSILSSWKNNDQQILLSRPIFDQAVYGAVRFHHRSVREYLTAEWFSDLLKKETSRHSIEGLFFKNQYGLDIIVPTLRPILPWLILLDSKILTRVLKIAPEIIFEGGDPSQLPLDVRSSLLQKICKQMADNTIGRSMRDFDAVQRFANQDLSNVIQVLIKKYAGNSDLSAFLFRIVWIGQLTELLTETIEMAQDALADRYTRIAAIRAMRVIGSSSDNELIRQKFLVETSELNREWLIELIIDISPTLDIWDWLFKCLKKIKTKESNSFDYLLDALIDFVKKSDVDLLPRMASDLNFLLNQKPFVERRYCEISEKYQSMLVLSAVVLERLLITRNSLIFSPEILEVFHKVSSGYLYATKELSRVKVNFQSLVTEWEVLNRRLFWFEVSKKRERISKKNDERLTDFWRVSSFKSFWDFKKSDFEYVTLQITEQPNQDDKLVAISLAFYIYRISDRPQKWRLKLRKLVAGNTELINCLDAYFNPPKQSKESKKINQETARWKKRDEIRKKKENKYHADWKSLLTTNLGESKEFVKENPGVVSNSLSYLYDITREKNTTNNRWTSNGWQSLIPEFGPDVAEFYKDSAIFFWKNYKPLLKSEGAPRNTTPFDVLLGLTGLEIESRENLNWSLTLTDHEVELACRYATFELNGFPVWFPALFSVYAEKIGTFLLDEIKYELSIEKADIETHYLLSDVSYSGQWSWDQIAPKIYILLNREPKNLSNLDRMLKIIQGSNVSDDIIDRLASRKCKTIKNQDHLARWIVVWIGLSPSKAIPFFETIIKNIPEKDNQTLFAMKMVTYLLGDRRFGDNVARDKFKKPHHLKALYLLMHKFILVGDDIDRIGRGVYSPGLRDDAQQARDALFSILSQIPGKESYLALLEIAKIHPVESSRSWVLISAKTKAEQDSDMSVWSSEQVVEFNKKIERTPGNHKELAELILYRLLDLKSDLEQGDSSNANILKAIKLETDVRKYIGRELREKSFERYSIPQEEELADGKKPDFRAHGVGFDNPIPIELKLADNWAGTSLFERLDNQLCGDYLRDGRSNRGIFVLVYRGKKKKWQLPNGKQVNFLGLTNALQDYWAVLSSKYSKIDGISIIGIDLTLRAG